LAHKELRRSRVLVAAAGLFLGMVVLWLRVAWLQIVEHGYYAERADRNQEQRVLLKPGRGVLTDRRGRVLARDLPTYSISAAPREMEDPRATARQLAEILRLDPRQLERGFVAKPRFLWVERRIPPLLGQRIADLRMRGVYLSSETRREYPLGEAAQEILGRTNLDNVGIDGLELELDDLLRGRPGWATLFRDGRGRSHALPQGMRRSPLDGQQVELTLDADLQAIVETHLTAAVDTLKALRGFAMFMDPSTGEVLAAATVPHLPAGKARNWNFTDSFEPGSTFKVVVAGAVLEEGMARPDQVFQASATGVAPVAPGALFHDTHPEATYTFADAVRWSSNIVMGRLGAALGPERLYRYATALGFGSLTGIEFPGETGGKLRSPDHWSLRSAPTIAIGHEVAVTPLQLTLAYAAVANGGVLMRPMLVREVRDPAGAVVRRYTPSAVQRVFSPATCTTLRGLLTAVVDSGTAKAARVPGLAIAGKTGTAQKYDAAVGTYGKGLYLSSFAGFAPAADPSLVGVVVIDEPRGKHHYGGEVAAPVFKRVVVDLLGLPTGALRRASSQVAARPPEPAPVTVPDLRLLPRRAAERTLAALSLYGRFIGEGPRVLDQRPPSGVAVERGTHVEVWLAAATDSSGTTLPDLVGLTVREALRQLNCRQVAVRIVGHGEVIEQTPPAGTALPLTRPCLLRCEPRRLAAVSTWAGPRSDAATAATAAAGVTR
jgi:cell division protein FtsI/penicillin-binding protein 2